MVTDVSLHGLKVDARDIGEPTEVEVQMHIDAFDALLPYDVVSCNVSGSTTTLHLRGREFNAAQAAFIRSLIERYRLAFEGLAA
jgi:hypothetical protein